jgi:hypothetical protein
MKNTFLYRQRFVFVVWFLSALGAVIGAQSFKDLLA